MRKNKYQILFFISFIPLIAVALILLTVAFAGYNDKLYYGLDSVKEWLNEYWVILEWHNSTVPILPMTFIICVSYQILYILKLNETDKNKKRNKAKVIFIISFVPYATVFLILLTVAFTGYYGSLNAVADWLKDYWLDFWQHNSTTPILPMIFIVCVSYQIVYALKFNEIDKNKKRTKAAILFIISFVPYLLLGIYAIYSSIIGLEFNAVAKYLCIIPILPFCIIYQIIYLILKRAEHKSYSSSKILFFVSFIPHVLVLLMFLIIIFNGYSYFDYRVYGAEAIRFWWDIYWNGYWMYLFEYDSANIIHYSTFNLTFIACSSYQIWYILKFRLMPQSKIEIGENHDESSKKKKLDAAKIIFIASFIPYLWVVLYAIRSSIVGITVFRMTSGGARGRIHYSYECYGIEAFIVSGLLRTETLCIYPIIPLCIIYQIVYLVLKKKTKKIKG